MAKREHRKFQVFISSTYNDLIVERQAVIMEILETRHIPAGMEFFTAYNETQLETMYRWIDELMNPTYTCLFWGEAMAPLTLYAKRVILN